MDALLRAAAREAHALAQAEDASSKRAVWARITETLWCLEHDARLAVAKPGRTRS